MAPLPASRFTSTAQVSIILLDVNDSPPTFISPKVTYVPENTPIDTIVFKAQATDPDSGPNSYIEYSLLRPLGNKFSIGSIDGEVRLTGELDREAVSNYTLTVVATDKGQPSLSSSTDVVVVVLDINDNNPLFAQKLYKVEVGENTLTGTDLIQVFATDGDEGTNGQVRYAIVSGDANNEFRIDSVTGVITVAKPLDREKKPSYTLTVQSADRGSSPRTNTTTVNIILKDVNDYVPTFELSPYSVNVPENLETLPKVILQVSTFTNAYVSAAIISVPQYMVLKYTVFPSKIKRCKTIEKLSFGCNLVCSDCLFVFLFVCLGGGLFCFVVSLGLFFLVWFLLLVGCGFCLFLSKVYTMPWSFVWFFLTSFSTYTRISTACSISHLNINFHATNLSV